LARWHWAWNLSQSTSSSWRRRWARCWSRGMPGRVARLRIHSAAGCRPAGPFMGLLSRAVSFALRDDQWQRGKARRLFWLHAIRLSLEVLPAVWAPSDHHPDRIASVQTRSFLIRGPARRLLRIGHGNRGSRPRFFMSVALYIEPDAAVATECCVWLPGAPRLCTLLQLSCLELPQRVCRGRDAAWGPGITLSMPRSLARRGHGVHNGRCGTAT
jgi:hypothetical protein